MKTPKIHNCLKMPVFLQTSLHAQNFHPTLSNPLRLWRNTLTAKWKQNDNLHPTRKWSTAAVTTHPDSKINASLPHNICPCATSPRDSPRDAPRWASPNTQSPHHAHRISFHADNQSFDTLHLPLIIQHLQKRSWLSWWKEIHLLDRIKEVSSVMDESGCFGSFLAAT